MHPGLLGIKHAVDVYYQWRAHETFRYQESPRLIQRKPAGVACKVRMLSNKHRSHKSVLLMPIRRVIRTEKHGSRQVRRRQHACQLKKDGPSQPPLA